MRKVETLPTAGYARLIEERLMESFESTLRGLRLTVTPKRYIDIYSGYVKL
jgi:hypothetical protein